MSFFSKKSNVESKKLEVKVIEDFEVNVTLDKFKNKPPCYVFAYGIPESEILESIYKFQKYKSPVKNGDSTKIKLLLCKTDPDTIFILFDPDIHPYMLYSLLSYMDSSNSIGFITRNNKTYMIKSEEDSDYIFGTTKDNENIEICIVDGDISKIEENKYPYFESLLDISKLTKLQTVEIIIEDVGEFGNPKFIIN